MDFKNEKNITIFEHPLIQHKISILRDKNTGTAEFSSLVEEIAKERSDIKVVKINVDEEQELAMQFGVMSIPTLVVMKNAKIVNQVTGARPKAQILAML